MRDEICLSSNLLLEMRRDETRHERKKESFLFKILGLSCLYVIGSS